MPGPGTGASPLPRMRLSRCRWFGNRQRVVPSAWQYSRCKYPSFSETTVACSTSPARVDPVGMVDVDLDEERGPVVDGLQQHAASGRGQGAVGGTIRAAGNQAAGQQEE